MPIRICIISAIRSFENICTVREEMEQLCDIEMFTYRSTPELVRIYTQNASRFDGFLFSGAFPHEYLVHHLGALQKPCACLEITDYDYFRTLARLMVRRPGLDLRRVYFEAPENQLAFTETFLPEQMPILVGNDPSAIMTGSTLSDFYESNWSRYMRLWQSGKVDLFLIRMANLAERMDKEGIPCIVIIPSRATILQIFQKLLNDIRSRQLSASLTADCHIRIAKETPTAEEMDLLEKALNRFNQEQNISFVLQRDRDSFDMVTSNAVMQELTDGCTTCLLTSVLYEVLPFSTCIGWGVGYDLVSARRNALRAQQQSHRDTRHYTYLVNDNHEMIGPLTGDRTIRYVIQPSDHIRCIASKLGISAANLNKLQSLRQRKQLQEFSSSDLVYYLGITPRSAARILKKLHEAGGAVPVRTAHLNDRGRPSVIYRIDLDNVSCC